MFLNVYELIYAFKLIISLTLMVSSSPEGAGTRALPSSILKTPATTPIPK